jgi:hypothetical protein
MTFAMNAPAATLTALDFTVARPAANGALHISREIRVNVVKIITISAAVIAVAQALLAASMATSQYALADLAHQASDVAVTRQIVQGELEQVSSLASLNAKARALGMVASTNPAFLRLADAEVLGVPAAATK